MAPNGEVGAAERRYLQAVYDLSGREAKSPVSVGDIKEHLGYGDDDAERCCDYWTACGALAWSNLGHVALTHVGLVPSGTEHGGRGCSLGRLLGLTPPPPSTPAPGAFGPGRRSKQNRETVPSIGHEAGQPCGNCGEEQQQRGQDDHADQEG